MRLEGIPAYELIMEQDISDIHSKGYLLKHKKSGARVMVLEMMTTTRFLILPSGHPRQTAQGWPIFWNTAYCAVPNIFL